MHGLASIASSPALGTLGLPRTTIDKMMPHAMKRLEMAMQ
jgi:hypothetical protein